MSILSWNCQGAASRDFYRVFMDMIRSFKPMLVGLLEPKVSGSNADVLCRRFGFDQWVRVEAVGFSGGIWVLWNDDLNVEVVHTSPQFVLLKVAYGISGSWYISFIYGSPTSHLRKKLWFELTHDHLIQDLPWVSIGDYNAIVSENESSSRNNRHCSRFADWIFQEGLIDLGFSGSSYTWMRGVEDSTFRGARLDRALANVTWCANFPNASVSHLPRLHSDHVPLLLKLDPIGVRPSQRFFKFQAAWVRHDSFLDTVNDTWIKDGSLISNLANVADRLQVWNVDTFGNVYRRKRKLMVRLAGIQRAITRSAPKRIFKLEAKLQGELDEVLRQEELICFQQSKEDWITSGDLNTKFYHASLVAKRRRKNIS